MRQIRCYSCGAWFDKRERECEGCGATVRPVNVALASQAWRSNLNAHAEHADKHT